MAFGGVFFSTFLFAYTLELIGFGAHISFIGLLVIASILGSTDPIAVSALLKELGAPHKLNMLLEGESLLNDGTSVVLFQTFMKIYRKESVTGLSIIFDVITLCIGGPLIGLIVGGIFYIWMRKSVKEGVLIVTLTFVNAFLLFFICEFLSWNVSGILALVLLDLT